MKYVITADISIFNSKNIRTILQDLGFGLFRYNRLLDKLEFVHDKMISEERVINLFDDGTIYHCIYNGSELPGENILQILEKDQSVLSYTIQKL